VKKLKRLKTLKTVKNEGGDSKPNRFACDQCDKVFVRRVNLKAHKKIHTPFADACPYCNKKFARKSNLLQHIRVHTDERPYRCTYCPRTFRQQHSLKGHVRTHTGERPYQCTFCRRKFAAKCNLKVHIRTHTGERPYQCTECNKQYASKSGFNAHRRKFHWFHAVEWFQNTYLIVVSFLECLDFSNHLDLGQLLETVNRSISNDRSLGLYPLWHFPLFFIIQIAIKMYLDFLAHLVFDGVFVLMILCDYVIPRCCRLTTSVAVSWHWTFSTSPLYRFKGLRTVRSLIAFGVCSCDSVPFKQYVYSVAFSF